MATTYLKYVMPQDRFEMLMGRYKKFISLIDVQGAEPVRVYDPLIQSSMDGLTLIREASVVLQKKKEDEMRKQREDENKVIEDGKNEEIDAENKVENQ